MPSRQIIRIEHADGWGMFRAKTNRAALGDIDELRTLRNRHVSKFPTPWKESGVPIEPDEFCAFKTIKQIQKWVGSHEFKILSENGYKIYLLRVRTAKVFKFQCTYKKEDITSKKDITELFI